MPYLYFVVFFALTNCSEIIVEKRINSIFKSIVNFLIEKRALKIKDGNDLNFDDLEFFFFDKNGIEITDENKEKLDAIVEYDNFAQKENHIFYGFGFEENKQEFVHNDIKLENKFYPNNIQKNQIYFALISKNQNLNNYESKDCKKYKVLALSRCSFSNINGIDYLSVDLFSSFLHGQYFGEMLMYFIFKCAFFENDIDYIILNSVDSAYEFYKRIGFQNFPICPNNLFYLQKYVVKSNVFRMLNKNKNN